MTTRPQILALACSALLSGCMAEPLYSSHRVRTQREAGSFHFSVVAVTPWENSVRGLQPKFELTEGQALDQVLATTRSIEESVRHTSETDLSVGKQRLSPPPDPNAGRAGDGGDAGDRDSGDGDFGDGSAGDGDGSQPQPAADPAAPVPQRPVVSSPTADLVKLADLLGLDPHPLDYVSKDKQDSDPLTRYWAATALYQEVRLLSQSLEGALVRHGYRPFIVRLKLTLLPSARREPYDAVCSLSFFTGAKDSDSVTRLPQVVPVLVTDDLERSQHSKVVDNTREIAAALKYLEPLAATNASVSDVLNKVQSVSGHDINSLFTVTRITDNTLGVRLGAVQEAQSDYSMIAQNHTVTALLLIPEGDGPQVDVLADARFVDVESGQELPSSTAAELDSEALGALESRGLGAIADDQRQKLVQAIRWNDWNEYQETLNAASGQTVPRRSAVELWQEISMLTTRAGTSITTFDLPTTVLLSHAAADTVPVQMAFASDDGTSTIVAVRTGRLPFDTVADVALLVGPDSQRVTLRPNSAQFDAVNQNLELHFDSLESWNLTAAMAAAKSVGLQLDMTLNGRSTRIPCLYRGAAGVDVGGASGSSEQDGGSRGDALDPGVGATVTAQPPK